MANPTQVWPSTATVDALDGTTDSSTGLPYVSRGSGPTSTPPLAEQYQRREQRQNEILSLSNAMRVVKVGDDAIGCFSGVYRIGTTDYSYAGEASCAAWTTMSDGTWYVYATTTGVTVGAAWPGDKATFIPLATVVRASSVVTTITDKRALALYWASSGGAGSATGTNEVQFILDEDNTGGAGANTQLLFRRGTSGNDAALRHVNASNKFQAIKDDGAGTLADFEARTLKSDVATGTAPLTIASTTVVTNLNSDQVDGIDVGVPVAGGVIYGSSATAVASSAAGSSGEVLVSAGTSAPLWKSLATAGIQALATILDAIAALASNGFIARTGSGTVAARTITATGGLAITNGDGVSGNPEVKVSGMTENGVMIGTAAGGASSTAEGADNTVLAGRTSNTPTFRKLTEADCDSGMRLEFSKVARGTANTLARFDGSGVLSSASQSDIVAWTIGTETANVIRVTFQILELLRAAGQMCVGRMWLSDDSTGPAVSGTALTSIAEDTGYIMETITTGKAWQYVTAISGDCVLDLTYTGGAKTWYLCVEFRGIMYVSPAITFAA